MEMDLTVLLCYLQNLDRRRRHKMIAAAPAPFQPPAILDRSRELVNQLRRNSCRELPNPFRLPDIFFCQLFNFDKSLVQHFVVELCYSSYYNPEYDTHHSIPFDIRVLATLNFLVHGHLAHLLPLDAFKTYSKYSLMRSIPKICEMIVNFMTPAYVNFPCEADQLSTNKKAFMQQFGVPGVVGVLDCFPVGLSKIKDNQRKMYSNRQGHISVNVQVICDQKFRFLDCNPRYPGGTSDIYVWKRSHVRGIMEHLYSITPTTWLVADRGYHLQNSLMNPYRNPKTPEELNVNGKLKKIHGVLDKAVAILRARFRCLSTQLPFSHKDCSNIITSCITLHNYLIDQHVDIEENLEFSMPHKTDLRNAHNEDLCPGGRSNRNLIKNWLMK